MLLVGKNLPLSLELRVNRIERHDSCNLTALTTFTISPSSCLIRLNQEKSSTVTLSSVCANAGTRIYQHSPRGDINTTSSHHYCTFPPEQLKRHLPLSFPPHYRTHLFFSSLPRLPNSPFPYPLETMASEPASCPSNVPPVTTHNYQPRGKWQKIAGIGVYVVGPPDSPGQQSAPVTRAIVAAYDVFGVMPQTVQGCDRMAEMATAWVLMVDFFGGGREVSYYFSCSFPFLCIHSII